MLPLPVPLTADVAVSQLGNTLIVHGHAASALTFKVPVRALEVNAKLAGDTVGTDGQVGDGAWFIVAALLPNMKLAVRAAPVALAVAVKLTGMLPVADICSGPLTAGINQAGTSLTSKWQPGAAVTVQLTGPPSAATLCVAPVNAIFCGAHAMSHTAAYAVASFKAAPPANSKLPFGSRLTFVSRAMLRFGPLTFQTSAPGW